RATKPAHGSAWVGRRTHRPRSLPGSMARSTRSSRSLPSRRGSPSWAVCRLQARRRISATSSRPKPRNGRRWSSLPTSAWNEPRAKSWLKRSNTGVDHANAQNRLAAGMDRRAKGASGARKGIHAGARPTERRAARTALGQGREELRVRGPWRQGNAGRPVRRPQPASGPAFHVRARLERRLQELLVLGGRIRSHDPPSRRARHFAGRDIAGAPAKAARIQGADGLDLRLAVLGRRRFQLRLRGSVYQGRDRTGRQDLQFRELRLRDRRRTRYQRLLPRQCRPDLPYLFM